MGMQHFADVSITVILLLSSLCVMCGHAQSRNCGSNARPHPRGICGRLLVRAHSNLCFLLNQNYPEYFPGKRSVAASTRSELTEKRLPSPRILERIYSIPLSVLANLDLTRDDWNSLVSKRRLASKFNQRLLKELSREIHASENSLGDYQGEDEHDLPETFQGDSSKFNRFTSYLLATMSDRRIKRQTRDSNMVCDCCYNLCTPRQLATYC